MARLTNDGVVVLNARGQAWVTLPDWFEGLNGDFRYQLTSIGSPQPKLYVAKELMANRFQIAGGRSRAGVAARAFRLDICELAA
jgi:hypothetical protein